MATHKSYIWSLSKEVIQNKVNKCFSMSDVLVEFGYSKTSGTMTKVFKEVFKEKGIDTTHFKRYGKSEGSPIPLSDILVCNSTYTNMSKLKERLLREGLLEYKCELCGNQGFWQGKSLTLQLDHKDGNHFNNELSNLRLLCPNCHTQTETFGSRNSKRVGIGLESKKLNSTRCPDKLMLKALLQQYSYTEIGKQRGVSGNAVKKWAKAYNIYEPKKHTIPDKKELSTLLNNNSVRVVAQHYNVDPSTVQLWINKLNIKLISYHKVKCREINRIFNTRKEAAETIYPNIKLKTSIQGIAQSCRYNKDYRGYHWEYVFN